jgi:hypothetical protein
MKAWEKDVTNSINGFENKDSLLLPIKHEYQPKGWCGNTGSAKVKNVLFRSIMRIFLIFFQRK